MEKRHHFETPYCGHKVEYCTTAPSAVLGMFHFPRQHFQVTVVKVVKISCGKAISLQYFTELERKKAAYNPVELFCLPLSV